MPRKTLAELKANPPRFTPEQRARLDAMSEDEIEAAAAADVESPPMTDAQLERAAFARDARRTREVTGLSQVDFARRYGINLGRLKDMEQGRFRPDSAVAAYLKVIRHDPEAVELALAAESGS